jgi:AraC family transcriptional regulator
MQRQHLRDYLARAIAAQLVRRHSSVSSSEARKNAEAKLDDRRVADAIDFMQAHLENRSISPLSLARPDSVPVISRAGSAPKVGQAPHRYLMRLRIERAQRLLSETGTSIAEIAFACGFANQEHLTRLFKRSCGSTPAAYRKSRRSWSSLAAIILCRAARRNVQDRTGPPR